MITNVQNYEDKPSISMSEAKALARCKKQHDYRYMQGLESATTKDYFSKGSFLHKIQEHCLTQVQKGLAVDDIVTYANSLQQEFAKDGKLVSELDKATLVKQLELFWKDAPNYDVLHVEDEFYVDLGLYGGTLLHGVIDGIIKDKQTGNTWIVEHKTASRKWSEGMFMFDLQSALYIAAVHTLTEYNPIGILYNFFYPLSTNKSYSFERKLSESFETRVHIVEDSIVNARLADLDALLLKRASPHVYREDHWGCNDCDFKALCYGEMIMDDTEHLRAGFLINPDKVRDYE